MQHSNQSQPSRQGFPAAPKPTFSLHQTQGPSSWESIDPSTIEVVDLTDPSPSRSRRRRLDSPNSDRPTKRSKGKDPEVYISLDDDDDDDEEDQESSQSSEPPVRHKSPSQTGSLSQANCVICLDSPTDLVATPCGHLFCDFCIRSALKAGHPGRGRGGATATYAGSCPICRRKFTTRNLITLEIKVGTVR